MTSAGSSGPVGRAAYEEAFPRVGDGLTLHVFREPAFHLTRWAAAAGVPAAAVTLLDVLLGLLVFALFWHGRYWPGLLLAVAAALLSVTALMLSRLGHAHGPVNRVRIALEIIMPPLWWWAWAHGLAAYGRPLEPIYATMVLWVVVGGALAINIVEGLVIHRFNGMRLQAWRQLDSRFALVGAGRNTNLVILAAALLFGRPDSGLVLVAWWTLIGLIFHAVRFAQLTEQQARRQKISSWLDR